MPDFYTDIKRTPRQREIFPVKFSEDIRKGICLRFARGHTNAEVHRWVTRDCGVKCSYNAVRKYRYRKRWWEYTIDLGSEIVDDPGFELLMGSWFKEWHEQWELLEHIFFAVLRTVLSKARRPAGKDFLKAVKILEEMHKKIDRYDFSRLNLFLTKLDQLGSVSKEPRHSSNPSRLNLGG